MFGLLNQAKEEAQKGQLEIASLIAEYQEERNKTASINNDNVNTISALNKKIIKYEQHSHNYENLKEQFEFSIEYVIL